MTSDASAAHRLSSLASAAAAIQAMANGGVRGSRREQLLANAFRNDPALAISCLGRREARWCPWAEEAHDIAGRAAIREGVSRSRSRSTRPGMGIAGCIAFGAGPRALPGAVGA